MIAARYLDILGRPGKAVGRLASVTDFNVEPAETVDVERLIEDPRRGLYCLADDRQEAIFVEVPARVDLVSTPFLFDTQYKSAERLISVPYGALKEASHRLPAVRRLIMIYMTGRCGSTLLSHALNRLESVVSLSEPDVPSEFAYLRSAYRGREAALRELLEASMRFVCRSPSPKRPQAWAVKPRIDALQTIDLFQATFPQVRNLFLYRDAVGWVASFYRVLKGDQWPRSIPLSLYLSMGATFSVDPAPLVRYLEKGATRISPIEGLTLTWLGLMESYLDARERGVPILAIRYAELAAYPQQVLSEICRYCELPCSPGDDALKAFEKDSQEGTEYGRQNPKEGNTQRFTPEQVRQITAILERHPRLSRSDIVVPGTLQIRQMPPVQHSQSLAG